MVAGSNEDWKHPWRSLNTSAVNCKTSILLMFVIRYRNYACIRFAGKCKSLQRWRDLHFLANSANLFSDGGSVHCTTGIAMESFATISSCLEMFELGLSASLYFAFAGSWWTWRTRSRPKTACASSSPSWPAAISSSTSTTWAESRDSRRRGESALCGLVHIQGRAETINDVISYFAMI